MAKEFIQVRADPADKALFLEAAQRAGMSLTQWVLDRCRWAAKREEGAEKCDTDC